MVAVVNASSNPLSRYRHSTALGLISVSGVKNADNVFSLCLTSMPLRAVSSCPPSDTPVNATSGGAASDSAAAGANRASPRDVAIM